MSKWTRKVLLKGAAIDELAFPPVLFITDGTVEALRAYSIANSFPVLIWPMQEWIQVVPVFQQALRGNRFENIVVRGFTFKGRKGTTMAIRRHEAVLKWISDRLNMEGTTDESIQRDIQEQIDYGNSRKRLRKPKGVRTIRPITHTPPITPLPYKDDPSAYPSTCMLGALDVGSIYTTRVYDLYGNEAWLMPETTFRNLPIAQLFEVPAEPGPEPERVPEYQPLDEILETLL